MTTTLAASAPGKVVLTGEYAVLDGAPAIAMAVDRRASVRFAAGPHVLDCVGAVNEGDTRLFDAAMAAVGSGTSGRFTLDTTAFVAGNTGRKLGIGSSAALTVALMGMLVRLSDVGDDSLETRAYRAHEELQGGLGSGVDIATSLAGGLVDYRRPGRRVSRLEWPAGLCMALISMPVSASTTSMLSKLDADTVDFGALGAAAEHAAQSWSSGDADRVVDGTQGYLDALLEFDRSHALGILAGGHERLVDACASSPLVYKPCGAGGGDVGIVLGTDRAAVDAFAEQAAELGYARLNVRMDPNGLAVSGSVR